MLRGKGKHLPFAPTFHTEIGEARAQLRSAYRVTQQDGDNLLNLRCYAILQVQWVATEVAHQLPEL